MIISYGLPDSETTAAYDTIVSVDRSFRQMNSPGELSIIFLHIQIDFLFSFPVSTFPIGFSSWLSSTRGPQDRVGLNYIRVGR